MDNVTLRAMVRGMWKDARNCADQGKPDVFIYSNLRDFACSYTYGFYSVDRAAYLPHVFHIAGVMLLNKAADFRRKGNKASARQLIINARFCNQEQRKFK